MTPMLAAERVPLRTVALEWGRIGVTGFGGPPAHIQLLRELVVARRDWMAEHELEDAIASCNLLPGPASTQLAIFCARHVAGWSGALVGGLAFVLPAVLVILALSALFLAHAPPAWVRGAGAGAGAAIAAVAVKAGSGLLRPSWERTADGPRARGRWVLYAVLGAAAAALAGPYLVLVLLACGGVELAARAVRGGGAARVLSLPVPVFAAAGAGGLASLAWVAFKVGALSYGGGFVIVPLMQGDAVHTYHWMSSSQFLSAVALGQVTPGPVVATVAAVGYAAHGLAGGALAGAVAFTPSFAFVLAGGRYFGRLRTDRRAAAFLAGAGPAALGAILGAAVPLAGALRETWQFIVLGAAAIALLVARLGIVVTLVASGLIGTVLALAGVPVPH
jgi:chromate transporter